MQETINAFERSFRTRAWVSFPLGEPDAPAGGAAGAPSGSGQGASAEAAS